ncbi:hypothetical protein [Cloacibacillus porcorum]
MDAWIGALKKRQITESADIIELLSQLHSWQQEGGVQCGVNHLYSVCCGKCGWSLHLQMARQAFRRQLASKKIPRIWPSGVFVFMTLITLVSYIVAHHVAPSRRSSVAILSGTYYDILTEDTSGMRAKEMRYAEYDEKYGCIPLRNIDKEIENIEREMARVKAEHDKWFKKLPFEKQQALERMSWWDNVWDNVIVIGVLFGPPVMFFLMN